MASQVQRVILTGASRGIGAATAQAFSATGAELAIIGRPSAALEQLLATLRNAHVYHCDLADGAATHQAVSEAAEALGGVDVLVNNAGVLGPLGPMHEADPAAWMAVQAVNLGAVFQSCHAVLPIMLAQGGGRIVNVSSGAGHRPVEGWSAYCASKAAAFMVTQSLHHDYAAQGIRALSLSPGTVATQMQRDIKASGIGPVAKLDWEDHTSPEIVARAILFLASNKADGLCGQETSLRDAAFRQMLGLN